MSLFDGDPTATTPNAPVAGSPLERVQPNNLLAEQSALGGMLLSKDAIARVGEVMQPEDHYRLQHELIHRAITDMYQRRQPVDPITVAAELDKRGELGRVGGASYLHTLVNSVPTAANADYYAEIVHGHSLMRQLIEAGTRIAETGYKAGLDDPSSVVDAALSELRRLATAVAPTSETREWDLDKVVDETIAAYSSPPRGLPVPWADLQVMAPMEPGNLIVFAARPGMGKTVALMDAARHASIQHKKRIHVASMEMGHIELGQRIIAAEAEISLHRFRTRELQDHEWARIDKAILAMRGAPLRIDDTPAVPVSRWRARLRQLQMQDRLPAALVVDYLQIAKAEAAAGANRTGEVDKLASDLKALAQEFQIVVIAAAQLNRKVEERTEKIPMLSDLRESGAIEANASVVVLLHREDYYDKESARAGELDMIVAKNRMGPTGTVTVAFKGHMSKSVDMNGN